MKPVEEYTARSSYEERVADRPSSSLLTIIITTKDDFNSVCLGTTTLSCESSVVRQNAAQTELRPAPTTEERGKGGAGMRDRLSSILPGSYSKSQAAELLSKRRARNPNRVL